MNMLCNDKCFCYSKHSGSSFSSTGALGAVYNVGGLKKTFIVIVIELADMFAGSLSQKALISVLLTNE